jgi:hypothetical protein
MCYTTIRIIIVPIYKAGGNSRRVSFPCPYKTASSILVIEFYINYGVEHGFSKCGTRTTTDTPTINNWHAALIKGRNIKSTKILKINTT